MSQKYKKVNSVTVTLTEREAKAINSVARWGLLIMPRADFIGKGCRTSIKYITTRAINKIRKGIMAI